MHFRKKYPDRYYRIVYEALVNEPDKNISSLMSWLDESYEPSQLNFSSFTHASGIEDPKIAFSRKIHSKSIARWKGLLSGEDTEKNLAVDI